MNNQLIGGLSPATLNTALRALTQNLETLANGAAIERYKAAITEIQAISANPVETVPEWSDVLLQLEVVREAHTSRDSAERLKNMDAGKALREAIDKLKAMRASQHQGAPLKPYFPTMLRKMWSGGEVQKWINELGPLYRKPPVSHGSTAALRRVYDVIGLDYSHDVSVLVTNFENIKRFSDLLHAVERAFFMVPGEPSGEPEDEGAPVDDDCLLNCWGSSQEQYLEQFRTALLLISKPAGEAVAHIQFGEVDSGEIGDYEIEPNRKVCEALNIADNGNASIYDLYLFPRQDAAAQ